MRNELSLPRSLGAGLLAVLMLFTGFTQAAFADDFGNRNVYHSGSASQNIAGYSLEFEQRTLRAILFRINTGSDSDPIMAYCIESTVSYLYDHELVKVGWDEFPGSNAFGTDATVRAKVAWIAQHTYPKVSLEELAAAAGISGLTREEAISASQAALWTLTDGLIYKGVAESVSLDVAARIQQLINYLTGPANTGLQPGEGPLISVTSPSTPGIAGQFVGPIRVQSSSSTVSVISSSFPLVNAEGTAVDPNAVPTDTDLFVDVPAGTPAGEATFRFATSGPRYAGSLLISRSGRTQTIVIVDSESTQVDDVARVTWNDAPTPTPTPTPGRPNALPKTGVAG